MFYKCIVSKIVDRLETYARTKFRLPTMRLKYVQSLQKENKNFLDE